jgi:hypothetical protein
VKIVPPDDELFDTLFDEDSLYDADQRLAARDLPPLAWRVSQRAVDEVLDFARLQLDLAWQQAREHRQRARLEAAILGSYERPPR